MKISDLVKQPAVKAALDALLSSVEQTLADAATLAEIPSPTFHEQERAAWVQAQFEHLGLTEIAQDDLHSVYGRLPGRSQQAGLLISAHTDTVFPLGTPLKVRREGNMLYGPGLFDNSIAVASLLAIARALKAANLQMACDLWFVANTGEEAPGNLRGMRAAVKWLQGKVDAALVFEGDELGYLVHGGIAVRRFQVRCTAQGGHSWGDYGRTSAVHALVQLGAQITALNLPLEPKTTLNIGVFQGGTGVTAIAQHAEFRLDMRSLEYKSLATLVSQVETLIYKAAQQAGIEITVETLTDRRGGETPRNHPLVESCRQALEYLGYTPRYEYGSTDASASIEEGLPAVCIGLARGGKLHSTEEYMETSHLPAGLQQALLAVLGYAGT